MFIMSIRGVGIGGATGARAPLNFPVGGLKVGRVGHGGRTNPNVHSGLHNLDISLTVN